MILDQEMWLDSKKVYCIYSIKKQSLYRLLQVKKIHSKSIVQPGSTRGKRLWSKRSIDQYLASTGDGIHSEGDEKYIYSPEKKHIFPLIEFIIEPQFDKIVVPHQR